MKVGDAGVLFIKEIKLSRKICARYVQIRLLTPADYFHMHPSICSLEWEPRPVILFDSPLDEAWFHCKEQATGKEPGFGAEDGANPSKPARLGREKEPLVISLATKYWR
jgi:hypothetical protein